MMKFLKSLFATEDRIRQREDAYLNESGCIYDLEYRMRQVDRGIFRGARA